LTAVAVLDPCSLCISCSAHACSRTGDYRPCTCTRTRTLRFRRTLRNCTAPAVPPTPYDPVPLIPSMPLPRVVLRELFPSASQLFFVLSFPRGVVTAAGLPSLCLCTFLCLCFDLDFTCPYQSTSSLHRGQRRAERLSYPPAGLEGSSLWLVFACYARGRHRCASSFALAPSPALHLFSGPLRRAYLPNSAGNLQRSPRSFDTFSSSRLPRDERILCLHVAATL